jgi:hypothetical protein
MRACTTWPAGLGRLFKGEGLGREAVSLFTVAVAAIRSTRIRMDWRMKIEKRKLEAATE